MKGAWPVKAQATGGRHYRGDSVDQNFDSYSVEYTFADGTKLFLYGRCIGGCFDEFGSYAHGSRGSAIISVGAGVPAKCSTYRGQNLAAADRIWRRPENEPNPYELEWEDLVEAKLAAEIVARRGTRIMRNGIRLGLLGIAAATCLAGRPVLAEPATDEVVEAHRRARRDAR